MPEVRDDILRHRRDELGLSNTALAQRMGRKVGYVQNVVCGADNPGWPVIYALSRALDLDVADFVSGERKSQGDPSEPPNQPSNEPKAPPKRKTTERTAPKRTTGSAT